jgi:hypothetical protein
MSDANRDNKKVRSGKPVSVAVFGRRHFMVQFGRSQSHD